MSQTRIVIKPDNTIDDPAPLACAPGDAITFVVENRHRDDQNVWIDPDRIVHKHDGRKKNPLAHGKKSVRVAAGRIETIQQQVKDKGEFEPGVVTRFRYTIEWDDGKGGQTREKDPDLEVTAPPN